MSGPAEVALASELIAALVEGAEAAGGSREAVLSRAAGIVDAKVRRLAGPPDPAALAVSATVLAAGRPCPFGDGRDRLEMVCDLMGADGVAALSDLGTSGSDAWPNQDAAHRAVEAGILVEWAGPLDGVVGPWVEVAPGFDPGRALTPDQVATCRALATRFEDGFEDACRAAAAAIRARRASGGA